MKERQAVQTIMEDKIKVLLANINSSSGVVLRDLPEAGGSAGIALRSNISALSRLVNAFIAALKNTLPEEAVQGGGGEGVFSSKSPPKRNKKIAAEAEVAQVIHGKGQDTTNKN